MIEDESQYTVKGGCATIVAIFYAGKLYVGNAGDCRFVTTFLCMVIWFVCAACTVYWKLCTVLPVAVMCDLIIAVMLE